MSNDKQKLREKTIELQDKIEKMDKIADIDAIENCKCDYFHNSSILKNEIKRFLSLVSP